MNPPPFFISAPQRRRRKPIAPASTPAPDPNAPVLASAEFVLGFAVDLSFDRDVDISAIDPTAFILDDDTTSGNRWRGTAFSNAFPNSFRMNMEVIGAAEGSGVTLIVSAGNGVVSQADGTPWAGVTNLALPYP